jgi:hypothetical protein
MSKYPASYALTATVITCFNGSIEYTLNAILRKVLNGELILAAYARSWILTFFVAE